MHKLTTPLTPTVERLRAEQQSQWDNGQRVLLETLLPQEATLDRESLLDLIYAEVLLREEHGETPMLEEYLARFPNLADSLRRQFTFHHGVSSLSERIESESTTAESTVEIDPSSLRHRPTSSPSIQRIGSYDLLEQIGQGGMGIVYRAQHCDITSRLAALKVIRLDEFGDSDQVRQRWTTEGWALAALDHPNIVRMYEWTWAEVQGRQAPVVVMEYIVGGTLADRIDGTPLPPREVSALLRPLAEAVAHAHQRHVVHRDLKPSNVLLTENETPKISDFGLSKRLGEDTSQTRTGTVMGTPSYMAPEQASGHTHQVGPSADVYALGAMMYECLTGRPPFKAATILATLDQVMSLDPVPPSKLQPGIPVDLETICLKCLEKSPTKRYASADALAEDLRRFHEGQPILARRAGLVERTSKWIRRHPAAAALSAVSALSLLALVSLWAVFTLRLRDEKQHAIAQRDEAHRQEAIARRQSERAANLLASAAASVDEIAIEVRSAKTEELISGNTGSVLFKLACSYAKTSATLRAGGDLLLEDRTKLAEQYAISAVRLLKCAQQLGFFNKDRPENRRALESATELESLRDRADYKEFLALVN